jgi:glycosyltransferase involved in cell wall biosynthesis
MKECMGTGNPGEGKFQADQPLVSIVLATYNPRIDWLKEQLDSLERQTYRPLELLILDDCSTKVSLEEIRQCVKDNIRGIPYQILQNKENLGSTKTFEKLTMLAGGEFIAYCDQDDVWHGDKIQRYLAKFSQPNTAMVFSDMNIIDACGNQVADSITKVRKRHKFQSGAGLAQTLLFRNFVTGCAMMMKAEEAKGAVPFCPYMVHDHWLALFSSTRGEICFLSQSLIDYRVHGNNQTLLLAGVKDKNSYLNVRIITSLSKFLWLQERIKDDRKLSKIISQAIEWMTARRDNFIRRGSGFRGVWKYRRFSRLISLFEIAAVFMPERLFYFFIVLGRKNII